MIFPSSCCRSCRKRLGWAPIVNQDPHNIRKIVLLCRGVFCSVILWYRKLKVDPDNLEHLFSSQHCSAWKTSIAQVPPHVEVASPEHCMSHVPSPCRSKRESALKRSHSPHQHLGARETRMRMGQGDAMSTCGDFLKWRFRTLDQFSFRFSPFEGMATAKPQGTYSNTWSRIICAVSRRSISSSAHHHLPKMSSTCRNDLVPAKCAARTHTHLGRKIEQQR